MTTSIVIKIYEEISDKKLLNFAEDIDKILDKYNIEKVFVTSSEEEKNNGNN